MRLRNQRHGVHTGVPCANWWPGHGRRRERNSSLSVACLLLGLVLLLPAVGSHSTHSGDHMLEQDSEETTLLMFLPERLTLWAPEAGHVEAACLWPAPTWTPPSLPLPAVVAAIPLRPLPRGTSPFPLRV